MTRLLALLFLLIVLTGIEFGRMWLVYGVRPVNIWWIIPMTIASAICNAVVWHVAETDD